METKESAKTHVAIVVFLHVIVAAGLLSASTASAQFKVGVINLQCAVLGPEIKKASNEMQAKFAAPGCAR